MTILLRTIKTSINSEFKLTFDIYDLVLMKNHYFQSSIITMFWTQF